MAPFNSVQEVLNASRIKSNWSTSLNGTCKFHYSDTPEGTPSFIWINGKEVGYNEGAQEPAGLILSVE